MGLLEAIYLDISGLIINLFKTIGGFILLMIASVLLLSLRDLLITAIFFTIAMIVSGIMFPFRWLKIKLFGED